jgi:hypothetical protein
MLCGFHHIDGDELFWSTTPEEKALFAALVKAFDFWFEGSPAPPALWHPYIDLVLARVRAASAAHADVCVSLTVYNR